MESKQCVTENTANCPRSSEIGFGTLFPNWDISRFVFSRILGGMSNQIAQMFSNRRRRAQSHVSLRLSVIGLESGAKRWVYRSLYAVPREREPPPTTPPPPREREREGDKERCSGWNKVSLGLLVKAVAVRPSGVVGGG